MYDKVTMRTGVGAVQQFLSQFTIEQTADGVTLALPDKNAYFQDVAMPDRLRQWLLDLRLLRNIPIAYFVPDAALLPPESIRFFHIDPTWMDRVVDGVFSAANTGTVDAVFSYTMLAMVREALDNDIAALAASLVPGASWNPGKGLSGMLIRSELVRRWPNLVVRAYGSVVDDSADGAPAMPVLRAESISKDIYIAVFAGVPSMVHVREPNVGVRFGVEPVQGGGFQVDKRDANGNNIAGKVSISLRNAATRTVNVQILAQATGNASRMVALHLEQRPYVQEFKNNKPESRGSLPLSTYQQADGTFRIPSRRPGRLMQIDALQDRAVQLAVLNPKEKP